jgi:hypothetical protein
MKLNSYLSDKNWPAYNTDNKGHLFVTVFDAFCFLLKSRIPAQAVTRSSAPNSVLCNMTNSCLRLNFYRDTAPVAIFKVTAP